MKLLSSVIILALTLATPALRADTITGTLRTVGGLPVANAAVDLTNASGGGGGLPTTTTDSNGFFTLLVSAGTYDIFFDPPAGLAPHQILAFNVAGTAALGFITIQPGVAMIGIVRNQAGMALQNSDINVYEAATGVKLYTPNDGTSATGAFSVVVPLGVYNVRAAPPAAQILVAQLVSNVVVTAAVNVGIITLPPGFVLTGTVLIASTNAPVANADIDVDFQATGVRVQTPSDNTTATGAFSVIVPAGTFVVSVDPLPGVALQGRQVFNVAVGAATNLGTILLQPGFIVTGTVLGPGNVPVVNGDIDVDAVLGGVRLYTSHDSTLSNGTFSIVLPTGSYRLTFHAPAGSTLVGTRIPTTISGNTTLPTVFLSEGFPLNGTITAALGGGEAMADIDIINPTTLEELVTPADQTNASGQYSILVPLGTWTFRVQTRKISFSRDASSSILIGGAATYNQSLSLLPIVGYLDNSFPTSPVIGAAPVVVDFALYNPTGSINSGDLYAEYVDAAGTVTSLGPPLVFALVPQEFLYLPALPVGLPALLPAHSGLPHRLRIRITEPGTQIEIETDDFSFIRQ